MDFALSLKQPWAALLVHGRKTIEVRRWSTARRGRVLIHAARVPDQRPEAWVHVTPDIEATARLGGGIIGEARLVGCNTYRSLQRFVRDQRNHLNRPEWFQSSGLYGFVFTDARPLPFRRLRGSLYFFRVEAVVAAAPPTATGLLVSVRGAAEAAAALEGGADLIDVKEPRHGPLGAATPDTIAEVVQQVAGRRPVSAALGELAAWRGEPVAPGLAFVKCGLAGLGRGPWRRRLETLRERVAACPQAPEVVTVAYADWQTASAPPWADVARFALKQPGGVLLVDTFDKTWRVHGRVKRPPHLLDCLSAAQMRRLCDDCHAAGVRIALAGSLRLGQLLELLDARPTWFAVRGAVCAADDRDGGVHHLKVCSLAELLRWKQAEATAGSSTP
jgi:uncharacterized protein (UPF0264 family)